MRFFDIKENGGRVVKGVNTTPDVGVDAIKKQAAKFGNKVDKDGRPPTLSKKVKGSKTNVLFNLGMAESAHKEVKKAKFDADLKLPNGKNIILQADDKDHTRGLVIRSNADGSYDSYYWYNDPKKKYPIEIKIDNKSVSKDAKNINWKYHPELKESQVHELQSDELSEASEIYIDMDGVLVDFFGEWTKMQGVKDWKQIKNVGKALQDIRDTEDFWLNLKPTPNADKLLGLVKEIRGEYNILSAPLADDPRAEPHKREWIEKNLTAFPPKKVIITTDKAKYATSTGGTPNILIDDFGQNVAKWESAGGVGFKHKDHKFERTAKELKAHMNKPVDEEQVSELIVKQQRPKIDVIQNIADRKDSKPFPLSYKDTGGASTGGTISLTPDQARKFIKFYDSRAEDEQELMQKALTSVNNAKKLFNNFGMEVDVKLPNNPDADIPQSPMDRLKKNLDKDKTEGELIPNPKDTFLTKSDTAYDFVRVGKTISNLDAVKKGANRDEPDVMIVPMGGKKEKQHLKKGLKRVGYKAQDAGKPGDDAHVDEREEKVKSKDKEVMKGFDPETIQALAQLRAKYPHASDPLDALLKSVIDTDQDNDAVDDKQDSKLKRIVKTIKQLEPKIRDLNNRLSGVEVQINNVGKK